METHEQECNRISKMIKKQMNKNPHFKVFIASKTGNNATGRGANRSVILATVDGKQWFQYYKVWGKDNEKRANQIINQSKQK